MEYTQVTDKFVKDFLDTISSKSRVYITCHYSSDDDAFSSTLSLYYYLSNKFQNKDISMVITGNSDDRFSVFDNYSKINFVTDISDVIKPQSLLILLDGSQFSRFSHNPEKLASLNIDTICIDHHATPSDTFNLSLKESTSSSTVELIYIIAQEMQNEPTFCSLVLFGILGDTGTFNYIKPHQLRVFDIVKNILTTTGVDIQEYKSRYNLIKPETFEIIKEFIKNTHYKVHPDWPNFSYTFLSRAYISMHQLSDGQISEAADIYTAMYLRTLKGFSWGITFKPYSDGSIKLSLRSLPGSVNVRQLAQDMDIGGGHDRAAGGSILPSTKPLSPSVALNKVLHFLNKNKPVIS